MRSTNWDQGTTRSICSRKIALRVFRTDKEKPREAWLVLDFMLCILKQTDHIQQGITHVFFNKSAGDFCRVSFRETKIKLKDEHYAIVKSKNEFDLLLLKH
jgi:hypothetical protein